MEVAAKSSAQTVQRVWLLAGREVIGSSASAGRGIELPPPAELLQHEARHVAADLDRLPVHRYLVLLHRFQEGRLSLGGGPVDLIGQQNLAKDGAPAEDEVIGVPVEDRCAGHVRREQVWRELDALVLAAE